MLTVTPDIILRTGYDILDHAHDHDLHTELHEARSDEEKMMTTGRDMTHERSTFDMRTKKGLSTIHVGIDTRRDRVHTLQVVAEADHPIIDLKKTEVIARNIRTSQ